MPYLYPVLRRGVIFGDFFSGKVNLIKDIYDTYDAARNFDYRDSDSVMLRNCSPVADAGAAPTHGAAKPREPTGRKTKRQYFLWPMFEETGTYFPYFHAVINCAVLPVCNCPTLNVCLFLQITFTKMWQSPRNHVMNIISPCGI